MRHSPTHRAQLDKGGVRVRALTEEVTTKREVKHVEELSGPGRGGRCSRQREKHMKKTHRLSKGRCLQVVGRGHGARRGVGERNPAPVAGFVLHSGEPMKGLREGRAG